MKKLFVNTILAGAIAASASFASAQTIFTENFDGYANQAAFASAWSGGVAGVQLGTDGGHSGSNYAQITTGTTVRQGINFPATTPSDSAPMVVDFWIRVPGAQSRAALGLGTISGATVSALLEFGNYNAPAGDGWFARAVNGGPSPNGWTHLGGTRPVNTWTNLKIIINSTTATFYENGTSIGTITRTTSNFTSFNGVYLGLNASTTHSADFDDIVISTTSNVSDWNLY